MFQGVSWRLNNGVHLCVDVSAVFKSRKLSKSLSVKENKPTIVNTRCVVYLFQCDLCHVNYVGYTARHLHQCISEHRYSAIRKHHETQHGNNRTKTDHLLKVLRKCNSKFDSLVYEKLYIKDIKPFLNLQADSIRAKLFTWHFRTFFFSYCVSYLGNYTHWTCKYFMYCFESYIFVLHLILFHFSTW